MLEKINSLIFPSQQAYPGRCFITISSRLLMSRRYCYIVARKKRSKLVNEENENIRLTKNINHSKSFLFASLKLGNAGVFKV